MSKTHSKAASPAGDHRLRLILFWICASLLAAVPLVFTSAVYRIFVLPKFVVLITGSAAILLMLSLIAARTDALAALSVLKSKQVALVSLFLIVMAVATFLGVAPLASLFGSYQIQMGLITRLSFFICFIGLIVAVGRSPKRLLTIVWTMALTGLIASAYAFAQFVGRDPFLPASSYTFDSPGGPVLRVTGTLGHADYLGNFLLYTTPLAVALVIVSSGRARRSAIAAVALSIAAIIFSGTRGAWLGLVAGAITFACFEIRRGKQISVKAKKSLRLGAAVTFAIVLISALIIISSPISRSIGIRASSLTADQLTGSGRTLLWRDAIRMVPAFALTGCGPEGFSKAFLAYKSRELAIHAPQINNESSHNSYLDAAICFGLPGTIVYIAVIILALVLLFKSRQRASDQQTRFIITGLITSLVAVAVHNIFIYDQLSTGLYFFALMALAVIASNVTSASQPEEREKQVLNEHSPAAFQWAARVAACASIAVVVAAIWFSISLAQGDAAIKQAFDSVAASDFKGAVSNGERATRSAEPTGAYNFLFAQALSLYAEAIVRREQAGETLSGDDADIVAQKAQAITMAKEQAEKALEHTLTPESNYVLLAYLALLASDIENLHQFATEAIRWDQNYSNAHWLMAEALLAEGDRDAAVREARLALQLHNGSSKAASVLGRARGEEDFARPKIRRLVESARLMAETGKMTNAETMLLNAIQLSNGPCPVCHRELALVYEKANQPEKAIAEWEAFARESPDRAAAEQVSARIEALKQK